MDERLSDGVAMSTMTLAAQLVCSPNGTVCWLAVPLEPLTKGRTEIEAQRLLIVANENDGSVHNLRLSIRRIAFAQNAFIPVRKGSSGRLVGDNSCPRTFARRLIKVAMDNDVTWFAHWT